MKRFYMVCFDICDQRRLRRVSNALENFGRRVQRSVFECWLDDDEMAELKTRMEHLADRQDDHVRYYGLCPKDVPGICIDGQGTVTADPDYIVL